MANVIVINVFEDYFTRILQIKNILSVLGFNARTLEADDLATRPLSLLVRSKGIIYSICVNVLHDDYK